MRKIDYLELGGTLYIPIIHKNLEPIVLRQKYPFLTSIVICFEDSTKEKDIEEGLNKFSKLLNDFTQTSLKIFVRPRNEKFLKQLLTLKNIEKIDGFVLPKITIYNVNNYFKILENHHFYLMPTIENMMSLNNLQQLSNIFEKQNILTIRVGIEDILGSYGMIRKQQEIYFDNFIMGNFFFEIYKTFKQNFNLSTPVYPFIEDNFYFSKEIEKEKELQLFNKTIIHPNQSLFINENFKISQNELEIANQLLENKEAIFKKNGRMYEYATHKKWAENIIKRAKIYGTK